MTDAPKSPFYMVCRSPRHAGAKTEPRQRFSHMSDAINVAERLAAETGQPHVVLGVVKTVHPANKSAGFGF
jgi:hypothetical protein